MLASTSQRRDRLVSLQLPGAVWLGSVPTEPIRRLEVGIPALDTLLGGGLPRGCLSEIVGAPSSGRTAVLAAMLATATRRGEVVAVVDFPDALHPETHAAIGADLGRILWVRPPSLQVSLKCTDVILAAGGFGAVMLDLSGAAPQRLPLHVWPRLARLAKQAKTALAVLTHERVAGSFATVSLSLTRQHVQWNRQPSLLDGMTSHVALAHNKLGVTPARPAHLIARR